MGWLGERLRKIEGTDVEEHKESFQIPDTLDGMESMLDVIFLDMDNIKQFPNLRKNPEADLSFRADHAEAIVKRLTEFLKRENEMALNSRMKEINDILKRKGGLTLESIKNVFEAREKAA